ncbi:hepatic lectin-like [Mercenaria mercenaria]|uniref:hepatic lectin-like n=1 Tax=Mercenaria mercenaria TaxID=6596 RepID=UPI00234E5171|nr:hepatic lectin-like [Mercenaria mercenaria]
MLRQLKDQNWWLGLADRETEGSWKLVGTSTSPVFANWSPGEPESAGGRANEDCAVFYKSDSFRWIDVSCSSSYYPVCEK